MSKSKEELEAEREESLKQINLLIESSRPKGLGEIVPFGVGIRPGGLLDGVVTSAQIVVAGVTSVPQHAMAHVHEGRWWNENEGRWVLTRMDQEAKALEGVPEDDSDILGEIQEELDASSKRVGGSSVEVVDMYYYEMLDLDPEADLSTIKRRTYLLARQYHPDRVGPDDKEAAAKFKELVEAFHVLSDPDLRDKYNKHGSTGIVEDKTVFEEGGGTLFSVVFGSGVFDDYTGRLASATAASIGHSPKVSADDARVLQKRRVTRLALKLIAKISPWISHVRVGADVSNLEADWRNEAIKLSEASYGYGLVTTIGKVYNLMAIVFEESSDGGQGLKQGVAKWATAQKASLDNKNVLDNKNEMTTMRNADMVKLQVELQKKLASAKTDAEREEIRKELQDTSVSVVFITAKDITSTIHEASQMVFFDQSVDLSVRKLRGRAVKAFGKIWMEIPVPATGVKVKHEEAAFAAILETIRSKDVAVHGQS